MAFVNENVPEDDNNNILFTRNNPFPPKTSKPSSRKRQSEQAKAKMEADPVLPQILLYDRFIGIPA
ncbi:MAG: hypothetical protein H7Z12_07330 [Rhodospirillaceae bacterium]|nr:hypothetical protein [Rhodospirillales bacterium]